MDIQEFVKANHLRIIVEKSDITHGYNAFIVDAYLVDEHGLSVTFLGRGATRKDALSDLAERINGRTLRLPPHNDHEPSKEIIVPSTWSKRKVVK